jgi:hypothetical protein
VGKLLIKNYKHWGDNFIFLYTPPLQFYVHCSFPQCCDSNPIQQLSDARFYLTKTDYAKNKTRNQFQSDKKGQNDSSDKSHNFNL